MPLVLVPAVTMLPEFPRYSDPNYNAKAWDWGVAQPSFGADMVAVGNATRTNAEYAHERANSAQGSAQTAAARLADVNTAVNAAQAAASYRGEWSALSGSLNMPATVTHQGRLWFLKINLPNVASQQPLLGSSYWGEVSRNDFTPYNIGDENVLALDRGLYRMNHGMSTLTLPANPHHGMIVAAINTSGTLTPVIGRAGKTIVGEAAHFTMNVLGFQIVLQYDSPSGDWMMVNGVTAFTPYSTSQPFSSSNTWTGAQNFTNGIQVNGENWMVSGENAQGRWIRWADGSQEIWAVKTYESQTFSSGAIVSMGAFVFPVPFLAAPACFFSQVGVAPPYLPAYGEGVGSTQVNAIYIRNQHASNSYTAAPVVGIHAKGRWK